MPLPPPDEKLRHVPDSPLGWPRLSPARLEELETKERELAAAKAPPCVSGDLTVLDTLKRCVKSVHGPTHNSAFEDCRIPAPDGGISCQELRAVIHTHAAWVVETERILERSR